MRKFISVKKIIEGHGELVDKKVFNVSSFPYILTNLYEQNVANLKIYRYKNLYYLVDTVCIILKP